MLQTPSTVRQFPRIVKCVPRDNVSPNPALRELGANFGHFLQGRWLFGATTVFLGFSVGFTASPYRCGAREGLRSFEKLWDEVVVVVVIISWKQDDLQINHLTFWNQIDIRMKMVYRRGGSVECMHSLKTKVYASENTDNCSETKFKALNWQCLHSLGVSME